jgi:fermentation-respiration switch protein FrsA (DUF1100 family)
MDANSALRLLYSLRWPLAACFIVYIGLMTLLYVMQRHLQYHPNSRVYEPAELGLPHVDKLSIATPDGESLLAWYRKAEYGKPTILYLHGNGGGLSNRAKKIGYYSDQGFGVLALSYRGYEGSTGSISEAGLVTDAAAAYDWLLANGLTKDTIVVVGESLGSGVAIQLAASRPVRALALEAPFANAVDLGAKAYWFFPVGLLMKDQYRSTQFIRSIAAPLLVQHGGNDEVVPLAQGQYLFDLANEPKQFVAIDNAGHDVINDPVVWKREIEFFEQISPPTT